MSIELDTTGGSLRSRVCMQLGLRCVLAAPGKVTGSGTVGVLGFCRQRVG